MSNPSKVPIKDLKPNQGNVTVIGRVLEVSSPRVINTKRGARTISNALLGDETGRVQVTLWGAKAGSLRENDVVEISGAWTTSFRGKVQLNVGRSTSIRVVDDALAPRREGVPELEPEAPTSEFKPRREFRGRGKPRY